MFFLGKSHSQDLYKNFLKKYKQSDLSETDLFEPINLKHGFVVKYSQDGTMMYANLISSNSVATFFKSEKGTGIRKIGGLCADFDSCFFWWHKLAENLIGKIYFKVAHFETPESYVFMDKNIKTNYLLLADINTIYETNIKGILFNVINKSAISFKLDQSIKYPDLKYLRLKDVDTSKITIYNINTLGTIQISKAGYGQ
jgi:hypothetical protein